MCWSTSEWEYRILVPTLVSLCKFLILKGHLSYQNTAFIKWGKTVLIDNLNIYCTTELFLADSSFGEECSEPLLPHVLCTSPPELIHLP